MHKIRTFIWQLMEIQQQHFNRDERFKMDQRFVNMDSEEESVEKSTGKLWNL